MENYKTVYYAHVLSIYNTPQEERDEADISTSFGFFINPNSKETQEKYIKEGWKTFEDLIDQCDGLVFRSLPDGSISAGVAKEIEYAKSKNKFIMELPTITSRRILSIEDTREYLKLVGQR